MAKRSRKKEQAKQPVSKPPEPVAELVPLEETKRFVWKNLLLALLIVAPVFWIYGPALHGDWLWDDDNLVTNNSLVQDRYGIFSIWLAPENLVDFFPLTASLQWLEWQLWPNQTFCYHLTNVILHACSSLLVWRFFSKLGLRWAWVGGLFFAVYPVMVESVAWMAELKNTLSMPPFLLAMCAWIDYDRRRRQEDYFTALGLFLVAMLCKTTMVMFPVVILGYAWWKRGRIQRKDLEDSAPFFAISAAVSLALIAYLRHGVGEETIPLGGVLSRLACAGLSLSFYFSKSVLPIELLPIYPQWKINPPTPAQFIPWLVLGVALYWLWTKRASWGRHALLGFGFFLINLVPFVGFRAISFMRFGWVMDHFLYLPILGLLGLAVAALGQLDEHLGASKRPYLLGAIAALALSFAVGSHQYAKKFVNSEALWSYSVRHYAYAWPAHNNLGNALLAENRLSEAKTQYEEALQLNPAYPEAHNNLGIVLVRLGQLSEAVNQFELSLKYCPDLVSAQDNLSKVRIYLKTEPANK